MICIVGDICQTCALRSGSTAFRMAAEEQAASQRRHQSINNTPPISRAWISWNPLAACFCLQTKLTASNCLPPCWQVRLSDHGAGWKACFSFSLGSNCLLSLSPLYSETTLLFFLPNTARPFFPQNQQNDLFLKKLPFVFNQWETSGGLWHVSGVAGISMMSSHVVDMTSRRARVCFSVIVHLSFSRRCLRPVKWDFLQNLLCTSETDPAPAATPPHQEEILKSAPFICACVFVPIYSPRSFTISQTSQLKVVRHLSPLQWCFSSQYVPNQIYPGCFWHGAWPRGALWSMVTSWM